MDKKVLKQYCDLRKEIADIKKRRDKLIKQKVLVLKDSVKGSSSFFPYTPTTFKIEGVQSKDSRNQKLDQYDRLLEDFENQLLDLKIEIEKYIETLADSRIRRILRFRYIDDLGWVQVAYEMGENATEESVRKEHERFLKNN